jgi:hypothetical protein
LPDGAGSDSTFTGLTGVLDVEQDYLDYASKVYVQGPGGRGSSGGASSYRDGLGNLATFVRVVDSPDCPPGTESTVAGNLLNLWSSSNGQHEITLNAERYGFDYQPTSVTAAQYRMAAWATYTPSWTSSGTAPALGNGTLVGGYRREGTTLHLRGQLIVGSTSTAGTGDIRMSLPSGFTTIAAQQQTTSAFYYDASATTTYRGIGIAGTSATYLTFQAVDVGTLAQTNGFANGDSLVWTGTIEIAP